MVFDQSHGISDGYQWDMKKKEPPFQLTETKNKSAQKIKNLYKKGEGDKIVPWRET